MESSTVTNSASQTKKKLGFIGAGQGGKELLQIFSSSSVLEISYVVDSNPDAPGMLLAKRLGIKTLSKADGAIKTDPVDFIIDTTGSDEIASTLSRLKGRSEVLSGTTALLLYRVMEESRRDTFKQVITDLSGIRKEIDSSTRDVSKTLHGINKISNELEVLAINAGIQASRAAQFGKGFAVVAGEVKATARVARGLAGDIERVINEISSMSGKIEQSLKKIV